MAVDRATVLFEALQALVRAWDGDASLTTWQEVLDRARHVVTEPTPTPTTRTLTVEEFEALALFGQTPDRSLVVAEGAAERVLDHARRLAFDQDTTRVSNDGTTETPSQAIARLARWEVSDTIAMLRTRLATITAANDRAEVARRVLAAEREAVRKAMAQALDDPSLSSLTEGMARLEEDLNAEFDRAEVRTRELHAVRDDLAQAQQGERDAKAHLQQLVKTSRVAFPGTPYREAKDAASSFLDPTSPLESAAPGPGGEPRSDAADRDPPIE